MAKGYQKEQGLSMTNLGLSLEELQGQPLELFAREGAKILLTVALEEEVTEFLDRGYYQRSHRNCRGYRNGHRERRVTCAARSQLLEAWQRRSQALEEVIPVLYVEGLSMIYGLMPLGSAV
jgi:transposase-like protein